VLTQPLNLIREHDMTLTRRQLIGLAAGGGLVGFPKIADLVAKNSPHRDPFSWDIDSIPATNLPVTRLLDLNEFTEDGWYVHDVSAGPSQDLLVLLGKVHWDLAYDPAQRRRPWQDRRHYRHNEPSTYRIVHQLLDGSRTIIDLKEPKQDYWWVQPLLPDEYLVVGIWPPENYYSQAADVLDLNGRYVRSFPVGSDVAAVQTTSAGNIWIGYYFEGINSDDSLSRSGAVCFDSSGHIRFRFNKFPRFDDTFVISDFYAMNIASESEAWLYYDSGALYHVESPLVRIINGKVDKVWRNLDKRAPVIFSSVFAIVTDRLLFEGGYRDHKSLYLVPFSGDSFRRYSPIGDGAPIESWSKFARASWLYLKTDTALYGVDASTLPPLA
jgi:hypothetical protein